MITVKYNNHDGELQLRPEFFFPTTKARIRTLYKKFFCIGERDASDYVDECLQHINKRIPEQEGYAKAVAKVYFNLQTTRRELKDNIKEKRKANGVALRGDELKEYKNHLEFVNEDYKTYKRDAEQAAKDLKKLKENRQFLLELRDG